MNRIELSDDEWIRLLPVVKKLPGIQVAAYPTSVDGLLVLPCGYYVRGAVPIGHKWRVLPTAHGKWNSVFKRFSRWCATGAWEKLLDHFFEPADLQDVSMYDSVIRAHACAAGARAVMLTTKRLSLPKEGLAVRFTHFVMAWVYRLNSY
jgi:hypothetical protein